MTLLRSLHTTAHLGFISRVEQGSERRRTTAKSSHHKIRLKKQGGSEVLRRTSYPTHSRPQSLNLF